MHNFLLFIPFLAISGVFWLVLALSDEVQKEYIIPVEFVNVPDSVTFISDPSTSLRISVRDKGSRLLSRVFSGKKTLKLDFRRFARDGVLRVTPSALQSYVKDFFEGYGQLLSISPDSLYGEYTVAAGRDIPVKVVADIIPKLGKTIGGSITVTPAVVKVYSRSSQIDTLQYVYTEPVVRRDVNDPIRLNVSLKPMPGFRMVPSEVTVDIPIEPLETRTDIVTIGMTNVPLTESLMVFPRTVKVTYLVPLSTPDISENDFKVMVDYDDVDRYAGQNVPLHLTGAPGNVLNVQLERDSVEYTVIHR